MFEKHKKPVIDWHYARPSLAEEYFNSLVNGPSKSMALFGMRRIGKTEFVVEDLIPYAEKQGAVTAYCSLWSNKDHPAQAIIESLEAMLLKNQSGNVKAKMSVRAELFPGIETAIGIDYESPKNARPASQNELRKLADTFRALENHKPNKQKLIIFDEIQTLGDKKEFATLTAALRTFLDTSDRSIKVVFTGSSKAGLRDMFEFTKAPFFNFSSITNFPLMDRGFADHLSECLKQASGRDVNTSEAIWKAFEVSGGNSAEIVNLVENALKAGHSDIESIWAERVNEIIGIDGYCERKWREFSPEERLGYLMVSEARAPYDKAAFEIYERFGFTRGRMQRAYAKLMNQSFIHEKNRASYQNLPLFDAWFKAQGLGVESNIDDILN